MAQRTKLDIETYNAKRNFKRTAEPKGRKLKGRGDSFVVQKHEASRLHWDFRLELDGVLKSWAVPKGPSLDPTDKRLAMRTEDHPLDYGTFEGSIPKGEYGGGTVMLWDRGRWIPEPGKDPSKTLEEGHLHFALEGERMKGEWVMFRLKGKPGEKAEPWMLKKVADEDAEPENGKRLVDDFTTSVATGRTMAEIASGSDEWRSKRQGSKGGKSKKKSSLPPPKFVRPQIPTVAKDLPSGRGWIHEIEYEGYRTLIASGEQAATAWNSDGKDWSDRLKALIRAAKDLPAGCLIDGVLVALDGGNRPNLDLLKAALEEGHSANFAFYAFDLLVDRGEDVRKLSNLVRKERLARLLENGQLPVIYGDHVVGPGKALFTAICEQGGKGVISKKARSVYSSGRTRSWLRVPCPKTREMKR